MLNSYITPWSLWLCQSFQKIKKEELIAEKIYLVLKCILLYTLNGGGQTLTSYYVKY